MPQSLRRNDHRDRHNDYWRLTCPQDCTFAEIKDTLRGRGIHFRANVTKPQALGLLWRSERGLLSYDACNVSTLQCFAEDRRLGVATDGMKTKTAGGRAKRLSHGEVKTNLISVLTQADENLVFPHFMDLPAELRVIIYMAHFQSFDLPFCPRQPPLCFVSKQLREEALPLFYSECTFSLLLTNSSANTLALEKQCSFERLHENTDIRLISKIKQVRLHAKESATSLHDITAWKLLLDARIPREQRVRPSDAFQKPLYNWNSSVAFAYGKERISSAIDRLVEKSRPENPVMDMGTYLELEKAAKLGYIPRA